MTQAVNLANFANNLDSSGGMNPSALNASVPVSKGGTGGTTSTGSGAVVLATSPTLVTPNLGTPTALVGTNITGTASALSIGGNAATATLANSIADGVVSTTAKLADNIVTPAKLTQPLTLGAAVASTSGTAVNFTSIPSWVKRITVMLNAVSTSGTSPIQLQIGSSSGIENTGYVGTNSVVGGAAVNSTTMSAGYLITLSTNYTAAAFSYSGKVTLQNISGNIWIADGLANSISNPYMYIVSGNKTIAGVLDRIRLTTANGTDTFDAGSINILYE